MGRYFVPVLFLCATAWLVWHNRQGGSTLVVPFVDVLFPASKGDPAQLGDRSAQVLAGATFLLFLVTVAEHWRALRRNA